MVWYKWYIGTWLSSFTRLRCKLDGRGLYRDLLDFCYQEGGIPDSREDLIRLAGVTPEEFDSAWAQIKHKFVACPEKPGWLVNTKALEVIAQSGEYSTQQSNRAKKGWYKRLPPRTISKSSTCIARRA